MKLKIRNAVMLVICVLGSIISISAQINSDCINPSPICEKKSYHYSKLSGIGDIQDKVDGYQCTPNGFREVNSKWLKFRIAESGTLVFTIDPDNPYHDIDFILFQTNDFDCQSLEEVRCMASGQSFNETDSKKETCLGSTGIKMSSNDEFEASGCKYNDDNYLKFLQAKKGETYLLFINDYHVNGSLSISFDGTAKLDPMNDCREEENQDLQIVNVFPSPAKELINVEVNFNTQSDEIMHITIMDLNSRRIKSKSISSEESSNRIQMDIDDLTSGSYLMRVTQGDKIAVKQFVKI